MYYVSQMAFPSTAKLVHTQSSTSIHFSTYWKVIVLLSIHFQSGKIEKTSLLLNKISIIYLNQATWIFKTKKAEMFVKVLNSANASLSCKGAPQRSSSN